MVKFSVRQDSKNHLKIEYQTRNYLKRNAQKQQFSIK